MKKTFKNIRTLAALLMAGAAFTACSSDDNSIIENQQPANPSEQVYTLTIKASNGDATTRALDLDGTGKLTASWANGDVLTVYNVTQDVALSGSLTASNASGSTADFTGTLSGPINEGDELTLTYHPIFSVQAFQSQDGTLKGTKGAEKYDMATATVTVNTIPVLGEITITEPEAIFTTKVAMIKLTLTDGPNDINATSLNVKATIPAEPLYLPDGATEDVLTFNNIADAYTTNGDGILYFALPSAETVAKQLATKYSLDDFIAEAVLNNTATITFTASDGTNTYTVDKPGYKFAAGKYYAATLTMATNITWTSSDMTSDFYANFDGWTNNNTHQGITVTASGSAIGGWDQNGIDVNEGSGTITFTSTVGNIKSIVITADNINIDEWHVPTGWTANRMEDSPRTLSWSGTASATVNLPLANGQNFSDISQVVFTVMMAEAAPAAKAAAEATDEDKGKLIGIDGNIYADVEAATAAGTTAVAKIIYIGTTGHDTYNHGLALALTDEGQMVWQDAINACSAKNTYTPVTDATWLLASQDQWNYMMGASGAGSYYDLRDGSNLQSGHYWSSTAPNDEEACNYDFDNGYWFDDYKEGYDYLVRACLAF